MNVVAHAVLAFLGLVVVLVFVVAVADVLTGD